MSTFLERRIRDDAIRRHVLDDAALNSRAIRSRINDLILLRALFFERMADLEKEIGIEGEFEYDSLCLLIDGDFPNGATVSTAEEVRRFLLRLDDATI